MSFRWVSLGVETLVLIFDFCSVAVTWQAVCSIDFEDVQRELAFRRDQDALVCLDGLLAKLSLNWCQMPDLAHECGRFTALFVMQSSKEIILPTRLFERR